MNKDSSEINKTQVDKKNTAGFDTILQHGGKSFRVGRGLLGAVETSVTFATPKLEDPPVYARLGNTANHAELEELLATLHGSGCAAMACGSGMAAITTTLLTLLRPGDHLLVQENCYGGTQQFIKLVLEPWGVAVDYAPLSAWGQRIKDNTAVCLVESISNPFCIPQNISDAVRVAAKVKGSGRIKAHGAVLICDNTFASPALCRPLELGADVVMESATKYLNGHSDTVAGLIAGSPELMQPMREILRVSGAFLPTASCAQLLRGLRTLALRMERHSQNGAAFADAMRQSGNVRSVWYGSRDEQVRNMFTAGWGGMAALELASHIDPATFLGALQLVTDVPSLGGTESTVTSPWFTTHRWESETVRRSCGITPQLLRFSIGLEHVREIIADVEQALKTASRL